MLFTTVEFAIFFLATFLVAAATARYSFIFRVALTISSYIFYAWSDWRYAFLLFECTLVNYLLGIWLTNIRSVNLKRRILTLGIVANLSILIYFKYIGFITSNLSSLTGINLTLQIALPIGISFYTFQGIAYLVDVYSGKNPPINNLIDFLLFKSFFPQLIAGPIILAGEFQPQLQKKTFMDNIQISSALLRIVTGLFKKVILAHYIATDLVDPVFTSPMEYTSWTLVLAAYGYAAQIYCDFSGYCDIAIGTATLLGFTFPENFNQPYRASTLKEFWRRWHMTLGRFLKSYVYIPLGGSNTSIFKTVRNLFITMLLGGIWHGASWTFITWGVLHGLGLALERLFDETPSSKIANIWGTFVTFNFVAFTWVFFRSETNTEAMTYIHQILEFETHGKIFSNSPLLLSVGVLASHFLPNNLLNRTSNLLAKIPTEAQAFAITIAIMIIIAIAPSETPAFIYFKF